MPLTAFYFIQMFFVSSNVAANNLLQTYKPKKTKEKPIDNDWNFNIYDDFDTQKPEVEEDADKDTPYFSVYTDPAELEHLDIIWQIVLRSELEEVVKPAMSLLVFSHLAVESQHTAEE